MLNAKRAIQLLAVAAVALAVGTAGCGSAPKPKELKELERILGEEGANEVKDAPGARKYYEESRKLRRAALDVWEEGKTEEARQYAIRGKIKYRTAEAIAKQVEVKKELEIANTRVEEINPKVQKYNDMRETLRSEVQDLHKRVRKAEQKKARQRKQRIKESEGSDDKDEQLAAQNQIERALDAKEKALEVEANEFAKGAFNRANNELNSAKSLRDSESYGQAAETAKSAKAAFEKARKAAEPKYEEHKEKQRPQKRLASLREKLSYNFGDSQIEGVGRGVKVVIPNLFGEGSKSILRSKQSDLETVAKLANEFDEFDITVDGFTRKGNATENLTISQVRAKRVKDFLKDEGVSGNRIDSDGHGQSQIRYPDTPSKNDRVEITFRISS